MSEGKQEAHMRVDQIVVDTYTGRVERICRVLEPVPDSPRQEERDFHYRVYGDNGRTFSAERLRAVTPDEIS